MRVDAVGEHHEVTLREVGVGAGGAGALGGADLAHLEHLQHRLDLRRHRPVRDRPHPARRQLRRGLHRTGGPLPPRRTFQKLPRRRGDPDFEIGGMIMGSITVGLDNVNRRGDCGSVGSVHGPGAPYSGCVSDFRNRV